VFLPRLHILKFWRAAICGDRATPPRKNGFVAVFALWKIFSQPPDPWVYVLLGTLGAAMAMLGPGAWSVDARLFGWKRLGIETHKN
jgi:hypothetical protein